MILIWFNIAVDLYKYLYNKKPESWSNKYKNHRFYTVYDMWHSKYKFSFAFLSFPFFVITCWITFKIQLIIGIFMIPLYISMGKNNALQCIYINSTNIFTVLFINNPSIFVWKLYIKIIERKFNTKDCKVFVHNIIFYIVYQWPKFIINNAIISTSFFTEIYKDRKYIENWKLTFIKINILKNFKSKY